MNHRAKEFCKSLTIVLLLCSVVLLALSAIRMNGASSPAEPPEQAGGSAAAVTDAAQPLEISALGSTGRVSYRGDFAALDTAFERFGGYLAEALDAAGDPQPATMSEFLAALRQPGVCFVYPCALPTDLLAAWLDAAAPGTAVSAQRLLLTARDGKVRLLTAGDDYWSFDTQMDAAAFSASLEELQPDGTFFAFENDEALYAALSPFSLIDESGASMPAAEAANPCGDALRSAAAVALGFNPYSGSYRDDAGATVYTESDGSLRITADGVLTLLCKSARFTAPSASDAGLTEYARALLLKLCGGETGDARLLMSGLHRDGGGLTVTFEYVLSGLTVTRPDGPAATAVFSGGILTELTLCLRTYTLDPNAALAYLPARQAAAIAAPGAVLTLEYADLGTGGLSLGWSSN